MRFTFFCFYLEVIDLDLLKKLYKEADVCEWPDLHQQFVHDALFVVKDDLDVFEIAVAIAQNDTAKISQAIEGKKLNRPDGYDVEKWRKEKQRFLTLIVSPYVVVKLLDIEACGAFYNQRAKILEGDKES